MAEKYVRVSELRKLLGIPSDGQCTGCQFSTFHGCKDDSIQRACEAIDDAPEADVRPIPDGGIGEMSDGYHTFNGLYHQRMMLFAALVKAYKDKAWKSYKHEDGELCFGGGWFIVGIDTPEGSYTYHYESKDFDLFDCVELPVAKHWDGHTEADVGRLMSLDVRPVVYCKDCKHSDKFNPDCTEATFPLKCLSVRYGGVFPHWFCEHGERNGGADDAN